MVRIFWTQFLNTVARLMARIPWSGLLQIISIKIWTKKIGVKNSEKKLDFQEKSEASFLIQKDVFRAKNCLFFLSLIFRYFFGIF